MYPVLRVYFACFDHHISLSITHTSLLVFSHSFNRHTVQDEPQGLRGSLEFRKGDGDDYEGGRGRVGGRGGGGRSIGKCFDRCCDYAGEDQVLLGSLEFRKGDGNDYEGGRGPRGRGPRGGGGYCDSKVCKGVFKSYGDRDGFCRDYE